MGIVICINDMIFLVSVRRLASAVSMLFPDFLYIVKNNIESTSVVWSCLLFNLRYIWWSVWIIVCAMPQYVALLSDRYRDVTFVVSVSVYSVISVHVVLFAVERMFWENAAVLLCVVMSDGNVFFSIVCVAVRACGCALMFSLV